MQQRDGTTLFSATDLVANLECEYLTVLDFQALGDAEMRTGKSELNIAWGKEVKSAQWFKVFKGERINDHHLMVAERITAKGKP